jgi:hypothetical protein
MNQSEQINELASALAKAQGIIQSASKDGLNPHFKNRYATLDSIWEAIRDPLSKNGLAVTQSMISEGDMLYLTTTLMHSSGQWIKSTMPLINNKATPQALGSACTYMRRYSLAAIVGATSGDDDDANEAEKHAKKQDSETVTFEQAEMIEANIPTEDAKYRESLLKYFRIGTFTELSKKDFEKCMKSVLKRKTETLPKGEDE